MKIWNKLDEVLGATMLTTITIIAMYLGYDSGAVTGCIAGIVALLAVGATKKIKEDKEAK